MTTREKVIDRIINMTDEETDRIISFFEKYNYDLDAIEKALGIESTDKLN